MYIIYRQRIWDVRMASSGWVPMEDRGSITANHYDHVHIWCFRSRPCPLRDRLPQPVA